MSQCMIKICADVNRLHAALPGNLLNARECVHRCCSAMAAWLEGPKQHHRLVRFADCQSGG